MPAPHNPWSEPSVLRRIRLLSLWPLLHLEIQIAPEVMLPPGIVLTRQPLVVERSQPPESERPHRGETGRDRQYTPENPPTHAIETRAALPRQPSCPTSYSSLSELPGSRLKSPKHRESIGMNW